MYIDGSSDKKKTPILLKIIFTLGGVCAGFLLFFLFFGSFTIHDTAMAPSLKDGDILIIRKVGPLKAGDIIICKSPLQPERFFVRRVAALEGELVSVKDKQLLIGGAPFSFKLDLFDSRVFPANLSPRDNMSELKVPEDHYFIVGDNFDNSFDSRFFGPLHKKYIVGIALFKL